MYSYERTFAGALSLLSPSDKQEGKEECDQHEETKEHGKSDRRRVVVTAITLCTRYIPQSSNCDTGPTPAKSEAIEYVKVGPTEIRYSIA